MGNNHQHRVETLKEEVKGNVGKDILIVLNAEQLNMLGQPFRPIFCGTLEKVEESYLTLNPVIVKMPHAPFYKFPTPLIFPFDKIQTLIPNFNKNTVFSFT